MPEGDQDNAAFMSAKAKLHGGGTNRATARDSNERLFLSLVQREGRMSRADIARASGLTRQAVTLIARALEEEGLVRAGAALKGKVGQPSIPLALNPDGAFSFGLKIGRRSAELVLTDFTGVIRQALRVTYAYPLPERIIEFARAGSKEMTAAVSARIRRRIAGIGIAMPFEMWTWPQQLGVSHSEMEAWRNTDMLAEIGRATGLPAFLENDATAACEAEFAFGHGRRLSSFVYYFVGFFIGGGVVLNHAVYSGSTGNAGALGAMPVPSHGDGTASLIDSASIHVLERMLAEAGINASRLWSEKDGWRGLGRVLDDWIGKTAENLAIAIVGACSVIDFEAAIIDGGFPPTVRARLTEAAEKALMRLERRGISPVRVLAGTQGADARAIGAARLPVMARYMVSRPVRFREAD
jgi:predicted NBD/HSP70 family sugar kinase